MNRKELKIVDRALEGFFEQLTTGLGRQEMRQAMADYITGLLLDGKRKSMQPMAERLVDDAEEAEAMRQRLQQCVVQSPWQDDDFRTRLQKTIFKQFEHPEALVIDDTGFPKKGNHSVGVHRQYSGTLGRVDNCQIAVSTHIAKRESSCCLEMQLYLPEVWTEDSARRKKAKVPEEIEFAPKTDIALAQLDVLNERGVPKLPVLADSGYGDGENFRRAISERGFEYVVSTKGNNLIWIPESSPEIPKRKSNIGRPRRKYQDKKHPPMQACEYALSLGREALKKITWDVSDAGPKSSYFGCARIRSAYNYSKGMPPGDEEWLVWQWPKGKDQPTKYWMATLSDKTPLKQIVYLAKLRWRIERDYQEMKQEVGLTHFEGRTWRGFHHHATLCMAAHAFLVLHRTIFSPQQS
jgi:SRSO17 transposase